MTGKAGSNWCCRGWFTGQRCLWWYTRVGEKSDIPPRQWGGSYVWKRTSAGRWQETLVKAMREAFQEVAGWALVWGERDGDKEHARGEGTMAALSAGRTERQQDAGDGDEHADRHREAIIRRRLTSFDTRGRRISSSAKTRIAPTVLSADDDRERHEGQQQGRRSRRRYPDASAISWSKARKKNSLAKEGQEADNRLSPDRRSVLSSSAVTERMLPNRYPVHLRVVGLHQADEEDRERHGGGVGDCRCSRRASYARVPSSSPMIQAVPGRRRWRTASAGAEKVVQRHNANARVASRRR